MTGSTQLIQFEFIRVSGPDARTFLQGQVTCDTTKITPTQSVLGALCNLKGRVIADFRAAQWGEDILLRVGAGLADPVLAVLKKYAVFSKLTLSKEAEFGALGLLVTGEPEGTSLPSAPHAVISLSEDVLAIDSGCGEAGTRCIELWGSKTSIQSDAALLATSISTESDKAIPVASVAVARQDEWIRLEILSGVIHITPTLSEEYTPAQLNYDISGVVDFKKGCYVGQELTARMKLRNKIPRTILPFILDLKNYESHLKNEVLENNTAVGEIIFQKNEYLFGHITFRKLSKDMSFDMQFSLKDQKLKINHQDWLIF